MKTLLEELVRTDGNRAAIERIEAVTQAHDKPEKIFLVGPHGSGKTEIVRSRFLEKDFLSTKQVLYRPCKELPEALRANVYDGYLEDLAAKDVLFLDDFEGFYEDAELGPEMCKLLLQERNRRGLDTVITASKPLAELDLAQFGGVLDDFDEVFVEPLEGAAMVDYVLMLQESFTVEGESPVLSDEAVEYLAHDFPEDKEMLRKAIHFLMTKYQGEPGEALSRHFVEEALAKQE